MSEAIQPQTQKKSGCLGKVIGTIVVLVIIGQLFKSCGSVSTVEEAKSAIVGNWYFADDTGLKYGVAKMVMRYDFKKDGTFESYTEKITEGKWGQPDSRGTYEIGSSKYIDTGEQYFYARCSGHSWSFVIESSSKLYVPYLKTFANQSDPF